MSTQKLRRNFRNTKNNKEHKLKQRKDTLQSQEDKLEKLKREFNSSLKNLIEFEEANIFSRDSDGTISNYLIENKILTNILIEYEKLINSKKENYLLVSDRLGNICSEIDENSMNLNNIITDINIFFSDIDFECSNQLKFHNKLFDKLNKLNVEMGVLAPLIFGKKIDSVLGIAQQLSLMYSSMELEKKQYDKIKKELKRHQHHTLTSDNNNNNNNKYETKICDEESDNELLSDTPQYKITDLKEVENEIRKLRKEKRDTMKKLIDVVYGRGNKCKYNYLREIKLQQALNHYNDSIIDDKRMSLKLESELLQIQCEEFINQLILLETKKTINESKQAQFIENGNQKNNINQTNISYTQITSKQISRQALTELHKLQKLEREQRNTINLTEKEILKIDKLIKDEKEKQQLIKNNIFNQENNQKNNQNNNKNNKNEKYNREKSYDLEEEFDVDEQNEYKQQIENLENKYDKIKIERIELEKEFNKNKQLLELKDKEFEILNVEISDNKNNKSELQQLIHKYENSIASHKYLSENALRKNSDALEFISDINFLNREYEIKMDQINNKYREKQTILKNKFLNEYNNKIKKNTKNRQTQVEQESYNIIQERNDKELTYLTQRINNQQNELIEQEFEQRNKIFNNKTKIVKIKFGNDIIQSKSNEINDNNIDILKNNVLIPITFEWNKNKNNDDDIDIEHNICCFDEKDEDDDDITDIDEDISDLSDIENNNNNNNNKQNENKENNNNSGNNVANYKDLILEIENNNIDIYNVLKKQMDIDTKLDEKINGNNNDNNNDNKNDGDIEKEFVQFGNVNFMQELLVNWTSLIQINVIQ